MAYFNTTSFLSLCSPLSDEHREFCKECVCTERTRGQHAGYKTPFYPVECALSYPHQIYTQFYTDECLKVIHC